MRILIGGNEVRVLLKMRLLILTLLLIWLPGCMTTTTAPDGTVTEGREVPVGFIGGDQGEAYWRFVIDLGFMDPISIGFKGKREPVEDSEAQIE